VPSQTLSKTESVFATVSASLLASQAGQRATCGRTAPASCLADL
jgi:hypothetical protein